MNVLRLLVISTLYIFLLAPDDAVADVIVSWDWNDGTTQGWTASMGGQSNEANAFRADNAGNGSLQLFAPLLPADTLLGLSTVTFDISILAYSTVPSPSQFTFAILNLSRPIPTGSPDDTARRWNLDLSNLAFGETRPFNLSINSAAGMGSLAEPLFFNLLFADATFEPNTSSARLDNFVVSGAVPEPPSVILLALGLLAIVFRNFGFCPRNCREGEQTMNEVFARSPRQSASGHCAGRSLLRRSPATR